MSIKNCLIVISLLFLTAKLNAQVNLQTGSAEFSLPMFNWQDNKSRLTTIVALDYNSGNGLRVNDVASNAGQGWSLIAGGVITRVQVGEPDDQLPYYTGINEQDNDIAKYPAGFLYDTVPTYRGCPDALTKFPIYKARNVVYRQHNVIAEDRQLDYFTFQFNGKAGMFVIDISNGGTGWPLGDTKMKISFQRDPGMIHNDTNSPRTTITSFTIQDVDGLKYKFKEHGMTKVLEQNFCDRNATTQKMQPRKFKNGHVYYQSGFENSKYINPWVINNWYLTEIEDPLTGRKDTLNYVIRTINMRAGAGITYHHPDKEYAIVSFKRSISRVPEITSITCSDGHTVVFNYSTTPRADLPGEYALSSIDIKYKGRYLSRYQLYTKYFILNRYGTPVTSYEKRVARLCLLSVKKIGVDMKEDAPPYKFDYYLGESGSADDFVPPPYFYAHDIWGYYNGNASMAYDGSSVPLNRLVENLSFDQLKGLCFIRNGVAVPALNPKAGYAKNGLLKQVIYPTGGTLQYQYTQNMGKFPSGSTDVAVGGVHVSQTKSTDGGYQYGCSNPLITHYNYTLNDGSSSFWGLEKPVNYTTLHIHYEPESRHFGVHHFSLGCDWRFKYPGILSQDQAVSLSFGQTALITLSAVMGIAGTVTTVLDVAKLLAGATGPGQVIADVVTTIFEIAFTCFADNTHRIDHPIYYDMDLNSISPLPGQFKRVEIVQGDGATGKTIETFTSDDDYPLWVPAGQDSLFSAKQRFAAWGYGLPKLIDVYDAGGHLIRETENVYDFNNAQRLIEEGSPKYFCYENPGVCDATGLHTFLVSWNCQIKKMNSQRNTNWSKQSQNPGDGGYDDPESYYNLAHLPPSDLMNVDVYGMYTGRAELKTTYEKTYQVNNPSQYVQTETDYMYNSGYPYYDGTRFWDNNYEVNEIITHQSNGDVHYQYVKYTTDYHDTGNVLYTLVQNNILSLPVETNSSVIKAGDYSNKYLSEQVTEFTKLANGDIKPSRILEQRFTEPQSSMNFYQGPGSNISNYKVTQSFIYDGNGDLIGTQDEGLHSVSHIYGYNDKYVIASVINANPLTDKYAYTSFEDTTFGGWTMNGSASYINTAAITGMHSLALSSGKSLTAPLNTGEPYTLSFWATHSLSVSSGATLKKSGPAYNGFTYYEYSIAQGASSVSVTGSGNIDELRLYPQKSRMSSVTYDPLIGKTSTCDENNRITYYEYDNLGRLRFVKDEQKNIIKMYEYNNVSAAKQNGCPATYYNHAISEVFTRNNCAANTVPDTNLYTYAVPANKYSSIISQEDADLKAEEELLANGQAQANANSACIAIYQNAMIKDTVYTETCDPGYDGGMVIYTVPAGRYTSVISQQDANDQAQEEADANAQWYANDQAHMACVYTSDPDWDELEADTSREYCNSSGHLMVYMTDINPHSSSYNQKQWYDAGQQDKCPPPPPPTFTLHIDNGTDVVYNVVLYNTETGNAYSYPDVPGAGQETMVSIPAGTYDIHLYPQGNTETTEYTAGCGYHTDGSGNEPVSFYSIPLSSGCDWIEFWY